MMETIIAWLGEREAAISAVVGMLALLGFVFSPIYRLVRDRRSDRGLRSSEQSVAAPVVKAAGAPGDPAVTAAGPDTPHLIPAHEPSPTSVPMASEATLAILPVIDKVNDDRDDEWADELNDDLKTILVRSSLFEVRFLSEAVPLDTLRSQGMKYALEIRTRPRGADIRIIAELTDLRTGGQFWSAYYSRQLDESVGESDFLALQIASQLVPPIIGAEVRHALNLGTDNLSASSLTRLAHHAFLFSGHDGDTFREARKLAEIAVARGPGDARALATRAVTVATAVAFGFSEQHRDDKAQAIRDSEAAIRLDPTDGLVLHARGWVCAFFDSYEQGLPYLAKSVDADATNAHVQADYGYMLLKCGKIDQAEKQIDRAFTLSPRDPRQYIWNFFRGATAFARGDPERALIFFEQSIALVGYTPAYVGKILACLELDRLDAAKETMLQMAHTFQPYITPRRFMGYVVHNKVRPEIYAKAEQLTEYWPDDGDS